MKRIVFAAGILLCTLMCACEKEYKWEIPDSLADTEWTFFDGKTEASMKFDGSTCHIKHINSENESLISEAAFEYKWQKPNLELTAQDGSGTRFEARAESDNKSYVMLMFGSEQQEWTFPFTYSLIGEYIWADAQ